MEDGDIPLNRTGKVSLHQKAGHLYHGEQTLAYTARLADHGANITCTVLQLDRLGGVLYTATVSMQLEVSELVIYSQPGVLEEKIGIISGIILAIIFIILVFILTALLLTRRRKKVPEYASVGGEGKGSDELLAPIWTPGRGGRTKVAVVSGEREYSGHHYLEGGLQLSSSGPGYRALPQEDCTRCQGGRGADSILTECRQHGPPGPDPLNISLESGESSAEHSAGGGHSLSRPTTRTTKTISSASDSSRSSLATERSGPAGAWRGGQGDGGPGAWRGAGQGDARYAGGEHTYINFQPEILSCELVRQGPLSPPDSDRLPSLIDRSESRASSRLHETHFGDSVHSLPCTVVHSPPGRGQGEEGGTEPHLTPFTGRGEGEEPLVTPLQGGGPHSYLARQRLLPLGSNRPLHRLPLVQIRPGNTIFDCELGCFITVEEYQQRRSREKLNVHQQNL